MSTVKISHIKIAIDKKSQQIKSVNDIRNKLNLYATRGSSSLTKLYMNRVDKQTYKITRTFFEPGENRNLNTIMYVTFLSSTHSLNTVEKDISRDIEELSSKKLDTELVVTHREFTLLDAAKYCPISQFISNIIALEYFGSTTLSFLGAHNQKWQTVDCTLDNLFGHQPSYTNVLISFESAQKSIDNMLSIKLNALKEQKRKAEEFLASYDDLVRNATASYTNSIAEARLLASNIV